MAEFSECPVHNTDVSVQLDNNGRKISFILPFFIKPGSLKLLSDEGEDFKVYSANIEGNDKVVKIKRFHNKIGPEFPTKIDFLEGTLEEKATKLNTLHQLIKKHFGGEFVNTNYIIIGSDNGDRTILKVEDKIKGKNLSGLYLEDPNSETYQKGLEFQHDMENRWEQFKASDQWKTLPPDVQEEFGGDDLGEQNIMWDQSNEKYIIIDY